MNTVKKNISEVDSATIRFAGDSGDGMQLTGSQFSDNTAIFGNDLATLPDFPAEIRAPKGSLAGVSSFQLQFSNKDIHTPGDDLDVLVAMNPAGLKVHLGDLKDNGMLIINTANFTSKNLKLAGYEENPLDDELLEGYQAIKVDMTKLVATALEKIEWVFKLVNIVLPLRTLRALSFLYSLVFSVYLVVQNNYAAVLMIANPCFRRIWSNASANTLCCVSVGLNKFS